MFEQATPTLLDIVRQAVDLLDSYYAAFKLTLTNATKEVYDLGIGQGDPCSKGCSHTSFIFDLSAEIEGGYWSNVNYIKSKDYGFASIAPILNDIEAILSQSIGIGVTLVHRKANQVAHLLARNASSVTKGSTILSYILEILHARTSPNQ
ncbi:hypothetical protein Salat_0641900 [Sesamum alatum]|uniref:RNase H type-1 domain-containing protein n=1 Tax=Sesamum alatum TaxID=300844 RepID=A0AAE1YQJ6_9LAMI|nr:hypothetical protein Salat_0641900 [Sesamum alatum]